MSNITDEEIEQLKVCETGQDWEDACERIKSSHKGRYPDDWYQVVIASGMVTSVMAKIVSGEIKGE